MQINGRTRLLGLIGNPVEHTLSPVIHNTISEYMNEGLDTVYVPFHVENDRVDEAIKGAFALNVLGMNVTVPHKQEVMKSLDGIDELAQQIGAVNTLVRTDKGYKGFNTDAEGFIRELDFYQVDVKDRAVVVLGAGGASKAVVCALAQKNPSAIYLLNRSVDKAESIASSVNAWKGYELVRPMAMADALAIPEDEYFAIQCTSVGLSPKDDECVIEDVAFFEKVVAGVDIVYKPSCTKFMKLCQSQGKEAYNGLRMLLYQGIAAYEKFCNTVVPPEVCEITARALEAAAGIRRPVILEGYMGSGKTSVANRIAKSTNLKVIDTDSMIVQREGMSISDIFATKGEQAFREMETALVRELCARDCSDIISLGGGLVLREENRKLLKRLGTVVYLKATAQTTYDRVNKDTSRPLLQGEDLMGKITSMLKERGPIYAEVADLCIDTDELTAQEIADRLVQLLSL